MATFCTPSVSFFVVAFLSLRNILHIEAGQNAHHIHCECRPWGFSNHFEQLGLVAVNKVVNHGEQHPVQEYSHAFCRHEAESFHFHYLKGNNLNVNILADKFCHSQTVMRGIQWCGMSFLRLYKLWALWEKTEFVFKQQLWAEYNLSWYLRFYGAVLLSLKVAGSSPALVGPFWLRQNARNLANLYFGTHCKGHYYSMPHNSCWFST